MACLIRVKRTRADGEFELVYRLIIIFGNFLLPPPLQIIFRGGIPIHLDSVKLNFDKSVNNSSMAGGFINQNRTGRLVNVRAAYYDTTTL